MPREYRRVSQYKEEIVKFKEQGITKREIGERLGLTEQQLHNFIT